MDGTVLIVMIVAGIGLAVALSVMFYVGWLWCRDEVERYERWIASLAPETREEQPSGVPELRWW